MKRLIKNKGVKTGLVLLLALSGMISYSCTGDFEDVNTNPNSMLVGDINAYGTFEPILYEAAKNWQNYTWFWNNELIQFTAHTGGTTREEHRYYINNGNWQSVWNTYARWGNDASHMYDLSEEQNDNALLAIALTYKVLFMSNLTDMFGDIPYTEAFTARKPEGTMTPRFETQKDVYLNMFADLERANDLYATSPIFQKPELDGMYGGDIKQWRKFSNSLYLRLLCRVCGRTEMNAGAKMKEMLDNPEKYPIFTSNEDNATVKFSGIDPYRNYFHNTSEGSFTSSGRKLTEQLIKMTLIADEITGNQTVFDPRLPIFGKKSSTSSTAKWKGTVSGCTREEQGQVNSGTSFLNFEVFCRADAPTFLMDYAEVQFVFAEAALKGLIPGGESAAKEYYTAAITASMQKWGELGQYSLTPVAITGDDIQTFLDTDFASWDKNDNKKELIGNQKYLALFWTGMEAYHEYRRTGYPILTIGAGTSANDFILPTRFGYPSVTVATNNANVQEAINRLGANNMKAPLWWSKQAIESGK